MAQFITRKCLTSKDFVTFKKLATNQKAGDPTNANVSMQRFLTRGTRPQGEGGTA